MVLRDPMRSAAQRCGLDELAERLGFDAATYDADDELQSELGAALEEEELDDREESVLELLIEHPHNAELISGLVEGKLFADRPIDGALFGWDGLQLCLYHPAQHDAVDAMREAARGFPHLLPPPAVHRTILKGEALAQATWQSLQLRRHTGEATTEAGQAKRRAVRDGCVLLEDRDALIAAALDEADLEAALILERFASWEDPLEQRALALEATLDRAFALLVAGFPTYASFLLKLGLHLVPQDDEARVLLIDLYLQQGQLPLARDELATLLALEAPGDDWRRGVAARVALLGGETEVACERLREFFAREPRGIEAFVEANPWTVLAGCECAMVTGEGARALPAYLNALLCAEETNWHGHRLQTYLNYLDDRETHPPMVALHRFANCLIAFPSDSQLWSLFNRLAEQADTPSVARQQVLGRVLSALPQSVAVWREVLSAAGDLTNREAIRVALQRRLGSQTSIR